jgi:hypothetical protein
MEEDDLGASEVEGKISALSPSQPFVLFLVFRAGSALPLPLGSGSFLDPGNSNTFLMDATGW